MYTTTIINGKEYTIIKENEKEYITSYSNDQRFKYEVTVNYKYKKAKIVAIRIRNNQKMEHHFRKLPVDFFIARPNTKTDLLIAKVFHHFIHVFS